MRHDEENFQIGVVRFLRSQGHYVFAVPNGNRNNPIQGHKYKIMGQMPGVSDLIVLMPGGKVYFIEIKNPNGKGRQSPSQREFEETVRAFGHHYQIWDKWEQAEYFVKEHRKEVQDYLKIGGTNNDY